MAKNIIIGQSGGPTAVINSSLAGVYKAARSLGADKVYGMKYGIEGLLKEEMLELNVLLDDRMSIELLKRTLSSYLGSCRSKLPEPDVDSTPFIKLFTLFDKYDICAVFYIGGNDSCLLYTSTLPTQYRPSMTLPSASRAWPLALVFTPLSMEDTRMCLRTPQKGAFSIL